VSFSRGWGDFLELTVLGPRNVGGGGGRMHVNHAYTLRKTGRTLKWGSYRSQHEGQTLVISNQ